MAMPQRPRLTPLPAPTPRAPQVAHTLDVDGELYADVQGVMARAAAAASTAPPKPSPIYDSTRNVLAEAKTSDAAAETDGYVKMGFIVKKSKKSKKWKPLYFALLGGRKRLFYFENDTAVKPKGIIDLASSYVYPLDASFFGRPNCFQVLVNGNAVYLCANTEAEASEWVQALLPYTAGSGIAPAVRDSQQQHTVKSLQLTVSEAKDFGSKVSNAYCIVSLNGVKVARGPAKAVGKDGSAFWGESFAFDDLSETVHELSVSVYSRGKKDKEVASVTVPVVGLAEKQAAADWMPMTQASDAGAAPKPNGRIRVKATWTDEVILPLAAFDALNNTLLDDNLATCQLLSAVAGRNLNELARSLVVIWRGGGRDVKLLERLNAGIVAEDDSVGTLFRGNSLASKAMDQYMKLLAIPFLHKCCAESVRALFEEKRSCELDTTRPNGKAENLKILLAHSSRILDGIFSQIEACPNELRQVFAGLRKVVMAKFSDHPTARYTSVSAFIFLRLFCPAIMNPKLFNMMPGERRLRPVGSAHAMWARRARRFATSARVSCYPLLPPLRSASSQRAAGSKG